jgi:transglutaminase-like putative cysteine protease
MRLRLGCELVHDLPAATPMIVMLNVHDSLASFLERRDLLVTNPAVEVDGYRDAFGNWCARLVAPPGPFALGTDGIIDIDTSPDPQTPEAEQHAVEDLPSEALQFVLPSRYVDSDALMDEAWSRFGHVRPGWERVQAVCEFVHNHIEFGYRHARDTRTASEGLAEGAGVCRDFTHLGVAFCRALNIPTRYCTGYIMEPPQDGDMDFCAWMECWLGGAWHVFDPRNLVPKRGRVLVARGRDAADVPLTHSFGRADLTGFRVWIEPVG